MSGGGNALAAGYWLGFGSGVVDEDDCADVDRVTVGELKAARGQAADLHGEAGEGSEEFAAATEDEVGFGDRLVGYSNGAEFAATDQFSIAA